MPIRAAPSRRPTEAGSGTGEPAPPELTTTGCDERPVLVGFGFGLLSYTILTPANVPSEVRVSVT